MKKYTMRSPRANQLSSLSASSTSESKKVAAGREVEKEMTAVDDLHQDLMPIIFNYLDNTVGGAPQRYVRRHTLFSNLSTLYHSQTELAAYHILSGNPEEVERLVNQNPLILSCIIEVKDHLGRRVKGTLLQIAALAGDFNIRDKKIPEKDHGMVERLRCYLPEEETTKQLLAIRPRGWKKETEKRMKPYLTALTRLIEDILKAKATSYRRLEAECKLCIETFKHSLIPNPNHVITSGYIFDLQVLYTAMELFEKNINRLRGRYSGKSDFFLVHGFGPLQACASVCDLQVFKEGIHNVINQDKLPNRSFNFTDRIPFSVFFSPPSHFLDIFGRPVDGRTRLRQQWVCGGKFSVAFYKSFVQAKKAAHHKLMQNPGNQTCSIL